MVLTLTEIYGFARHENHPTRCRVIGALIEKGKTDAEIDALFPTIIRAFINAGNANPTDTQIRNYVAGL